MTVIESGVGTAGRARSGWLDELHGWVTTVDHKRLGIMYVLAALLIPYYVFIRAQAG